KTGDTIMINFQDNITIGLISCYFIPPVYSTPPTPIVVEGSDYSTSEQQIMVNDGGEQRAKKWIDGKPIYQRVFSGNIVAEANTHTVWSLDLSMNISEIIDSGGWWQIGGTNTIKYKPVTVRDDVIFTVHVHNNNIYTESESPEARVGTTNNAYKIWVEYTKVVD
ncbi:MAG: hypothetical protein LBE03_01325, partial [Candidatus Nomurabacteria bacterium]|nr:hypothetical protein [Candidatus Nomurabacteria bacterium]